MRRLLLPCEVREGALAATALLAALGLITMRWFRQQATLERLVIADELYRPPIAGRYRDGRRQAHPWLRVLAVGHHAETGERYLVIQSSGSGAGWQRAAVVEVHSDEVTS